MRECLLHKVSSCLGGEVNNCDFNTNRDINNIADSHVTPFVDNLYIFIYTFTIIYHYQPPEDGRLYDMKVVSGYAFLRTYFV